MVKYNLTEIISTYNQAINRLIETIECLNFEYEGLEDELSERRLDLKNAQNDLADVQDELKIAKDLYDYARELIIDQITVNHDIDENDQPIYSYSINIDSLTQSYIWDKLTAIFQIDPEKDIL